MKHIPGYVISDFTRHGSLADCWLRITDFWSSTGAFKRLSPNQRDSSEVLTTVLFISLPLHFVLLNLIRLARLTIQTLSAEGQEIEETQMFLPKMTSIYFCLRAPLMVAAVFPKLTFSWWNVGGHYLAQAPSVQYCGTISVIPFHLSSKVSTAPAGSQGPKGSLQDNSDKRPQSLISRGLNMVNCAERPLSLPSVHPQKSTHWLAEQSFSQLLLLIEKPKPF